MFIFFFHWERAMWNFIWVNKVLLSEKFFRWKERNQNKLLFIITSCSCVIHFGQLL